MSAQLMAVIKQLEEKIKYAGNFRSLVTEVDIDNNDHGAIRVWIPQIMTDLDPNYEDYTNRGLIALPANNPIGGRNDQYVGGDSYFQGSVYVPPKGSWVWCWFENFNPNKPRYFAALDIENTKLPPENRNVDKPHKIYTILKTREGRTICVADSEDVQRIEITGKKRMLKNGMGEKEEAAGNDDSTYEIDGNQTTILLDEREGKEKILLRTYLGDYFHIDIDERKLQISFESDIVIKTNGDYHLQVAGDIYTNIGGSHHEHIVADHMYQVGGSYSASIGASSNITVGTDTYLSSGGIQNYQAGGTINTDATNIWDNSGKSQPATPPTIVDPIDPEGERET